MTLDPPRTLRRVTVLGSTGSIGTQALDVLSRAADRFQVAALSSHRSWQALAEQALRFRPARVCLSGSPEGIGPLQEAVKGTGIEVLEGPEGLLALAGEPGVDTVLHALVGAAGLPVALRVAESGKVLALANKESLVAAGALLLEAARRSGGAVVPVDSEHSAMVQCLRSEREEEVRSLLLTASGGPFRETPLPELAAVKPEHALAHPTWDMGPRITVDSATMVNKALEVIEARELFRVAPERIRVVIHPQSIVHSMVEFRDGSVMAQMGVPDMRIPIQFALTYPDRLENPAPSYDPTGSPSLTFEEPDPERYPALELGYLAAREGGTLPAVLNAADEVAVERFLRGEIPFPAIVETIRRVMDAHDNKTNPDLAAVLEADRWAREEASP